MEGSFIDRFESNVELLDAIAQGNSRAENELVSKFSKSLRFILSRRTDDHQLVADVVQDTFIVVISKARNREINNPDALAAFVRQTGINILLGHFRKEPRRATDAVGDVAVEIPDTQNDVAVAVESKESVELVQQVLNELKVERDRDILLSYFAREESKKDICERMELTPAHFDRVLYRARERVKLLLQAKLGGDHVFH